MVTDRAGPAGSRTPPTQSLSPSLPRVRAVRRGAAAGAIPFLVLSVTQIILMQRKSGSIEGVLVVIGAIWAFAAAVAYRYPRVIRLHLAPGSVGRTDFLGRMHVTDRGSLARIDEVRVRLSRAPAKILWLIVDTSGRCAIGINPAIWDPHDLRAFVQELALPFHPSDGRILSAQDLQRDYPGVLPPALRHPGAVAAGIGVGLLLALVAVFTATHR
jgi:hypothetical protein